MNVFFDRLSIPLEMVILCCEMVIVFCWLVIFIALEKFLLYRGEVGFGDGVVCLNDVGVGLDDGGDGLGGVGGLFLN